MKRSPRSRRLRTVLIPLNLALGALMLLSLTTGTLSPQLIAIPMMLVTAASIIAVIFER
jgi:hypothetical protein